MGSYLQLSDNPQIEMTPNSIFEMSVNYSISIWVWPVTETIFSTMVYMSQSNDSYHFGYGGILGSVNTNAIPYFSIKKSGTSYTISSDTKLSIGKWNNLIVTINFSEAELKLYLNGTLVASGIGPGTALSLSGADLNIPQVSGTDINDFHTSSINDFRFFKNHILTTDEISLIYNNGTPVASSDTNFSSVDGFYLNFDEGSGTSLTGRAVVSGVGSDVVSTTFSGGIDWRDESEVPFGEKTYVHGSSDAAVTWFDELPSNVDPKGDDFTISLWVNFDNIVAQSILDKHDGTDGYKIEMTSTGTIKASIGTLLILESAASLTSSSWNHICLIQDVSGLLTYLYVNNVVISTSISESSDDNAQPLVLFPGETSGTDAGFGVDNLRVMTGVAKSSSWVSEEYNGGIGGSFDFLHFNTDIGNNIIDNDVFGFQTNFLYAGTGTVILAIKRGIDSFNSNTVSGTLTWIEGGLPFSLDRSDISFIATSLEPNLAQTNFSQSIGGYPSTSVFSLETVIVQHVSLNDIVIEIKQPAGGFPGWSDIKYFGINDEVIEVEKVDSLSVSVVKRGVNGIINSHVSGSLVKGLSSSNLFNDVFSSNYKQYRCIAIKNTSFFDIGYNFAVYISQNSLNADSSIKIAVEVPTNQQYVGISDSWDNMKIVESSLIGITEDFTDASLTINNGPNLGQSRVVSSFDPVTGTIVLKESLPIDFSSSYSSGVSYTIDPGPAQRVQSGIISPVFNTDNVSDLSVATRKLPLSIDIKNEGGNKSKFRPNDVVYVWLERSLRKASSALPNNSVVIKTTYSLVPV